MRVVVAGKQASSRHSGWARKLRNHIFTVSTKEEGLERGLAYIISKPTHRGILHSSMLYHLPKQHHPLGTMC